MNPRWHPLDGNMIAADDHYSGDHGHGLCPCCEGEGCAACDEWDSANLDDEPPMEDEE